MARYFSISNGLRGCYMPDSAFVARVDSRRELKGLLLETAEYAAAGGFYNKREVASVAAAAWREAQKKSPAYLPFCVPMGTERNGGRPYGVFISAATRADWKEYQAESEFN
jgi:hypothetical protein